MAAYKSTLRSEFDSDLDESMSDASSIDSSSEAGQQDAAVPHKNHERVQRSNNTTGDLPHELRNRVLMLTSRGVTYRHRHLLTDLIALLPHTYRDTKLDTKSNNNYNSALNALADLHSCNYVFFFEGRKHQDLYLWLAKAPNGPTIRFGVDNVHTMGELGFGGNCLKGGRGIVVFDKSFEDGEIGGEYKGLVREMLRAVFCVPSKGIRGTKPFIDRIVGIYGLDGKIWIRIYEIRQGDKTSEESVQNLPDSDISLVEVGPRFVLTPIIIQEGSFGGPIIYENKQYVSPNQVRREALLSRSGKYAKKRNALDERNVKKQSLGLEQGARKQSALDDATLFG